MTITVFEQVYPSPSPTRRAVIRTAAIASPSPSPTPNRHTVREDDTLLEIALRYDVTLEALLAANPEVDPLSLQIGTPLVIPDMDGDASPPAPDAPPAPLRVAAPTCYPTPTDGTLCLGLVENNQDVPAERVTVHVQLLDAAGRSLAEQIAGPEQSYIEEAAFAPYRALFADVPEEDVASVVITLETAALTDTLDRRFVSLEITNEQLQPDGRQYLFTATLRNPSERGAASPRVVVTLRDAQKQVYGYRVWESDTDLLPGQQTDLRLNLLSLSNAPLEMGYTVHTEARALD